METHALDATKFALTAVEDTPPAAQFDRRAVLGAAVAATLLTPIVGETPRAAAAGLRVNPSDEIIRLGPLGVRFLITEENSRGSLAAFEVLVPGAQRLAAPAHSHDHYEETIYGISGVLTWTVNGKQIDVGPGQALCIPRGAIHRFDNNGNTDVKALCVVSPAAIGPDYFREAAAVINAATDGPPNPAKMIEIMRRHGITPARS